MKILALTDSLGESAGGLAHATFHLASSIARISSAKSLFILTHSDHNEIDATFTQYPANLFIRKIKSFRNSFYPVSFSLGSTVDSISPDLIHLRGIWRQGSLVALRWKRRHPSKKLIVQPAGMLEPWAFRRNQLIKRLFYNLVESPLFDACDCIHATSPQEADNLISLGLSPSKIFVIEEGILLPSSPPLNLTQQSEKKTLLFLSRIHPKKGLELLLDSLALVRPSQWVLRIVGMGHPQYIRELKARSVALNLTDIVEFKGPLYGSSKDIAFQQADAFILPTYSENFGIAVAEAMSWGLPVITTTATPWNVLQQPSLGWYVEPDLQHISQALYELFTKPSSDLKHMGHNCRTFVSSNYSWDAIGFRMSKFYDSILTI